MNVAAEMQWNLMPPLTCAAPQLVIGAALEPAYEIGGDAFDYSVADDVAHLAVPIAIRPIGGETIPSFTRRLAEALPECCPGERPRSSAGGDHPEDSRGHDQTGSYRELKKARPALLNARRYSSPMPSPHYHRTALEST